MEFVWIRTRLLQDRYDPYQYSITKTVYFFYEKLPEPLCNDIEDELFSLGFGVKHRTWSVYGKLCRVYEKYEYFLKFKSYEEAEKYVERQKEHIKNRLAKIYSEHLGMMRYMPKRAT
jgi:hypothetical protein